MCIETLVEFDAEVQLSGQRTKSHGLQRLHHGQHGVGISQLMVFTRPGKHRKKRWKITIVYGKINICHGKINYKWLTTMEHHHF